MWKYHYRWMFLFIRFVWFLYSLILYFANRKRMDLDDAKNAIYIMEASLNNWTKQEAEKD